MSRKIVVTGVGGPAGRATATFFRQRGFHVVGTDIIPVASGVDTFALVPRGDHPDFPGAILALLVRERPVMIVPTVSEELPIMSGMKTRIHRTGVQMFISDPAAVGIANDKLLTAMKLREHGIPVPRTLSREELSDVCEAGEHLGYPCLAKPRVGRGGRGVVLFSSTSEAATERRADIILQEFMPGEECDVNLFAYPAGNVRSVAVLRKTVMEDGIIGNAMAVERVCQADMVEIALRVSATLALEGPIDLDVRRDGAGVPRVLEINARVGANVLAAEEILESLLTTASEGD